MAGNRIAIVDDQESVRHALGEMLDVYGYDTVLFDGAEAFLAEPHREKFGCVVADVRMPGMDGIALVHELARAMDRPPMPIILISGLADVPMAVAALKAGATDFIEKPVHDVRLVAAINRALARPAPQSAPQSAQDSAEFAARFERLTAREKDVFDLIADGHTSQSIASNLGIGVRTVEGYRGQIMEKLQLTSIAMLVRLAIRLGRASA